MTDMIYFDSEKKAYGPQQYGGPEMIASVDVQTWSLYAGDPAGTTWDIINGVFVRLKPAEQIMLERKEVERSYERAGFYEEAERRIFKHTDFVSLGQDSDGSHGAMINAWRLYKMNVRNTKGQINYPNEVVYPSRPEE